MKITLTFPNYTNVNMIETPDDDTNLNQGLEDTSDLPTSVIITNMDRSFFIDEYKKMQLEQIFEEFDEGVTFQYFKSFRRIRINFSNPDAAAKARIECHNTQIGDSVVNCYFAQPITYIGEKANEGSDIYLQPPIPTRQHLISPPASPPVGWEPADEATPCINYDLLAALSKLKPGEAHELHPPSDSHPSIVVHVCEDTKTDGPRLNIIQTRRPDISS